MDVLAAQREKLDAKSAALQAEYNALDAVRPTPKHPT